LGGGTLITNPVPETSEIPANEINSHIEQALQEADSQGIAGKNVTPFLLGRMVELTDGKSLKTNIALIKNNANFDDHCALLWQ